MTAVIDASVAIKWVVPETGTEQALKLLERGGLVAPDLLFAECANILWKKTRSGELQKSEALIAARLIEQAPVEIAPTREHFVTATEFALALDHPAYDCIYLALAASRKSKLITADERLIRKLAQVKTTPLKGLAAHLTGDPGD